MTKQRIAAVLFSALLILGLGGLNLNRAWAAPQPGLCAAQTMRMDAGEGQAADGVEVVRESPTPLAQPIDGKNGPSPLILCGVAAIVVAVVVAAIILRKARKFE